MEAEVGDNKTLRIRRGYSQFGQPLMETLNALTVRVHPDGLHYLELFFLIRLLSRTSLNPKTGFELVIANAKNVLESLIIRFTLPMVLDRMFKNNTINGKFKLYPIPHLFCEKSICLISWAESYEVKTFHA